MRPNIEVMCIVKFQYATSAMLALPYDHFLVSLLFLDVPITVMVPSLLLTSFLNVFIYLYFISLNLKKYISNIIIVCLCLYSHRVLSSGRMRRIGLLCMVIWKSSTTVINLKTIMDILSIIFK